MNSVSKVVFGALAGAAAGAVVAWLFATEEGEEIREQLISGSKGWTDNVRGKLSDLKDTVAEKFEAVKQSASDLFEQGKGKAADLASNLK